MIRDVVDAMNAGVFAQIGLIAFLIAFILILIYVVTLPKKKRDHAKQIPLEDDEVHPTLN